MAKNTLLEWRTIAIAILVILLAASILILTGGEHEVQYQPVERHKVDHTQLWKEAGITSYNGSGTCISCHKDDVYEVFHSYHYQEAWLDTDIAGVTNALVGGKYVYNDFCGAIFWEGNKNINYIGKAVLKAPPPEYKDLKGKFIASGCSMCHGVSMGLIPSDKPTKEQLENIDCLACHADPKVYMAGGPGVVKYHYKIVYKDENGVWRYMVNPDISVETLAANIYDKPTSTNCLACHAFSGGGPHYKRPNLSPDMLGEVSEDFDVHLANGLSCIDCHKVEDHHFPTKSADTWSREPGHVPSCTDCHGDKPHTGVVGWILNTFHTEKVACQVCHIPTIAHGEYPTDTMRNWSKVEFLPKAGKYEPEIDLESNVEPVYAWYNGTRQVYLWPNPTTPNEEGEVIYVKPLGSKDDPGSKLYPFKLHYAVVPYSSVEKTLVPVKVGIVFATGNVTKAVETGAKIAGMEWDGKWVTLVRYMQVNHGVQPADKALYCFDCHGFREKRMPWHLLGYGHYPEIAFTGIVLATILVIGVIIWKIIKK